MLFVPRNKIKQNKTKQNKKWPSQGSNPRYRTPEAPENYIDRSITLTSLKTSTFVVATDDQLVATDNGRVAGNAFAQIYKSVQRNLLTALASSWTLLFANQTAKVSRALIPWYHMCLIEAEMDEGWSLDDTSQVTLLRSHSWQKRSSQESSLMTLKRKKASPEGQEESEISPRSAAQICDTKGRINAFI